MDGQRRRALSDSFRLATNGEQWLLLDLVLAVVGFVGWVGATGALAALGAEEVGVSLAIEQGSSQTMALLAGAVIGWIVLPAVAGTWRLRDRVTNVSSNVESHYRFDEPAALLAPPAALVLIAAVATVAAPLKWPALAVAFVAGAYLLVRTSAYSYRVYSFSHPLVVHLGSFLTFLLYATAGVVQLGAVVDQRGMVVDAADILGLPVSVYGTVSAGPITVPTLLTAAAAAPVVVSLAYLLVQSLVATYVVRAEPTVDRAALRAGQRNPFQPTAANGAGGQIRQPAGGSQPASPSSDDDHSVPSHIQPTRVFDPDGEVDNPTGTETSHAGPGDERCRTCGVAFSSGTEIRFCPNCGQRLDDG